MTLNSASPSRILLFVFFKLQDQQLFHVDLSWVQNGFCWSFFPRAAKTFSACFIADKNCSLTTCNNFNKWKQTLFIHLSLLIKSFVITWIVSTSSDFEAKHHEICLYQWKFGILACWAAEQGRCTPIWEMIQRQTASLQADLFSALPLN